MKVAASAWYELFSPTECAKRVRLVASGEQAAESGPYEKVLEELGRRHELDYLATLEPVVHIGAGTDDERMAATLKAIKDGAKVIYQPFFKTNVTVDGEVLELVGNPDFLILSNAGYVIRDAKLARHVRRDEKPEVHYQLQAYSFLFQTAVGQSVAGLEVYDGLRLLQGVDYEGPEAFLTALNQMVRLRNSPLSTYEPNGWSKCQACPFKGTCWAAAEARKDVSLVFGVTQEMAKSLHEAHIGTINALAEVDEGTLSRVGFRWGAKTRTIGSGAGALIRAAKALHEGKEIPLGPPQIPTAANYVSFDLEGLPPGYEIDERIYLWGIQVYGAKPGPYQGITSDFGEDGDRNGWTAFLTAAGKIFDELGDIPFITYSAYEATHVKLYIRRFGDQGGVGERVLRNIWDMLPAVKKAVVLPLYSYSLKQVEQHVGFKRTQTEFGGSWSVAQYIKAIETRDPKLRDEKMEEILVYNREDVAATWTVFEWLRLLGQKVSEV